jgi:NADH:ubiquinone oxidoreductase subunit C
MADQTIAPDEVESGSVDSVIQNLTEQFPDAVSPDGRAGFEGVVVDKNKLVEVATYIRDTLGYDYLSSATAVDYLGEAEPDSDMEMVYHA